MIQGIYMKVRLLRLQSPLLNPGDSTLDLLESSLTGHHSHTQSSLHTGCNMRVLIKPKPDEDETSLAPCLMQGFVHHMVHCLLTYLHKRVLQPKPSVRDQDLP